jgi:hypothetical protein
MEFSRAIRSLKVAYKAIIFNPVASTIPKWRTFELLR